MLDEGLKVLTGLWSGEPFSHRGEHYRVAGDPPKQEWRAIFYPPPLQRPRIPIWVGGTWPIKAPFRRATRWDGAFPMKVEDGRIVPMMPEDAREVARVISRSTPPRTAAPILRPASWDNALRSGRTTRQIGNGGHALAARRERYDTYVLQL